MSATIPFRWGSASLQKKTSFYSWFEKKVTIPYFYPLFFALPYFKRSNERKLMHWRLMGVRYTGKSSDLSKTIIQKSQLNHGAAIASFWVLLFYPAAASGSIAHTINRNTETNHPSPPPPGRVNSGG